MDTSLFTASAVDVIYFTFGKTAYLRQHLISHESWVGLHSALQRVCVCVCVERQGGEKALNTILGIQTNQVLGSMTERSTGNGTAVKLYVFK